MVEMNRKESAASAVWIAHGLVMNGGVLHCVESLSKRELRATVAGYRLFGLGEAADVLVEATRVSPDEAELAESRLDARYAQVITDDEVLAAHIDAAFPAEKLPEPGRVGKEAIASAIEMFVAASHDDVTFSSDPGRIRQQHRAHEREVTALKELLLQWDEGGHDALIRLLEHSDDAVRVSAACYLAGTDPDRAVPVLEELDEVSGPVGTNASAMLFVMKNMTFTDPLTRLRKQL